MQLLSQNRDVMNNAYTVDSTMGRPMFLLVGRYIISQVVLFFKKKTDKSKKQVLGFPTQFQNPH